MGLGGVVECTADGKADKPPNEAGTPDTADPEIGVESRGLLQRPIRAGKAREGAVRNVGWKPYLPSRCTVEHQRSALLGYGYLGKIPQFSLVESASGGFGHKGGTQWLLRHFLSLLAFHISSLSSYNIFSSAPSFLITLALALRLSRHNAQCSLRTLRRPRFRRRRLASHPNLPLPGRQRRKQLGGHLNRPRFRLEAEGEGGNRRGHRG